MKADSRDHPRGCGAHGDRFKQRRFETGSSPRVRGSRGLTNDLLAAEGIIPAGAGLTGTLQLHSRQPRDHPRGCGAHHRARPSAARCPGSSPRVRGSPDCIYEGLEHIGIIPAGAGLTPSLLLRFSRCRDHPRGCGAHSTLRTAATVTLGSSPRVRGSLLLVCLRISRCGIIPAGAGLTYFRHCRFKGGGDHPRGCGAHPFS